MSFSGRSSGLRRPFGTIWAPPERPWRGADAGTHPEAGQPPGNCDIARKPTPDLVIKGRGSGPSKT
eukprot:4397912-Pyramimonas_sp.AAC.1